MCDVINSRDFPLNLHRTLVRSRPMHDPGKSCGKRRKLRCVMYRRRRDPPRRHTHVDDDSPRIVRSYADHVSPSRRNMSLGDPTSTLFDLPRRNASFSNAASQPQRQSRSLRMTRMHTQDRSSSEHARCRVKTSPPTQNMTQRFSKTLEAESLTPFT